MQDDAIAAFLVVFVDDLRPVASSEDWCRAATYRAAQLVQYLGQQNACRKYWLPHTVPGPWCGSFIAIHNRCVWVYISNEKWNKAKLFINELSDLIDENEKYDIHVYLLNFWREEGDLWYIFVEPIPVLYPILREFI